jgi:hypothetical protein
MEIWIGGVVMFVAAVVTVLVALGSFFLFAVGTVTVYDATMADIAKRRRAAMEQNRAIASETTSVVH